MSQEIIASIGGGAVFGGALLASGVHYPSVIIDQFQLADFHMMKVFMVALGASAGTMFTLEKLNILPRPVRSSSSLHLFSTYDGNILGGSLIGVGMALTGACPGTVVVQLAQGIPSAQTVAIGALLGAGLFARIQHHLTQPTPSPSPRLTLNDAFHLSNTAIYTLFATFIAAVQFLPRNPSNYIPTPPILGGLLIGTAQALTLLSRHQPLGVSTSYEQITLYIWRLLGAKNVPAPPKVPKAIFFSVGIFAGALLLSVLQPGLLIDAKDVRLPVAQAVLGGAIMTFGARLAGGCTSGHGISGLGALSLSSLWTVVGMFGAGIAGRAVMGLF